MSVEQKPVLEPIGYGGYRVGENETHYIDVYKMIYNWRVVTTPKRCALVHDHGWCFFGTGPDALLRAVLGARTMIELDLEEPPGYDKAAF